MVLFDQRNTSIIISPLNNFMVASDSKMGSSVGFGIMGSMKQVEPGMNFDFILHLSDSINKGFEEWGNLMRTYYNKTYDKLARDITNNYLGYWTDNGMCYWYHSGKQDYEHKMLEIISTAKEDGLPIKYLDIDSWWYFKVRSGQACHSSCLEKKTLRSLRSYTILFTRSSSTAEPGSLLLLRRPLLIGVLPTTQQLSFTTTQLHNNATTQQRHLGIEQGPGFWPAGRTDELDGQANRVSA